MRIPGAFLSIAIALIAGGSAIQPAASVGVRQRPAESGFHRVADSPRVCDVSQARSLQSPGPFSDPFDAVSSRLETRAGLQTVARSNSFQPGILSAVITGPDLSGRKTRPRAFQKSGSNASSSSSPLRGPPSLL